MTAHSYMRPAKVIGAALAVCLAGCAATQPMKVVSPGALGEQVAPGDEVRILVADGRTFELEVEQVGTTSLTGVTDEGRRFKVPYSVIETLEVAGPGGAVGATVLVVGSVVLAALAFEAVTDFMVDVLKASVGQE